MTAALKRRDSLDVAITARELQPADTRAALRAGARQADATWPIPAAPSRRRAIRITLRQLTVFEAVARCGSIARASDEIALSQSAASMALRDLETHIGVELFAREGRRLILNDHGRRVQQRAASLLRQAEELEALAPQERLTGRLRIGAIPSLAHSKLSEACARFARLHPGVSIDLRVMPSLKIIGMVHRMALDLGFVGSPTNRSDIIVQEWIDDPLAIFCAPSHPLARRPGASLAEFLDQSWALERAASSERWCLTMEALKHMTSMRILFESDSVEAVKATVRTGEMIGCLSKFTIADEVARGELIDLRVPEFEVRRLTSIIWRKEVYQGGLQQAFLDFCET
jgi:DNA-binding transcriptional LysR family regulator